MVPKTIVVFFRDYIKIYNPKFVESYFFFFFKFYLGCQCFKYVNEIIINNMLERNTDKNFFFIIFSKNYCYDDKVLLMAPKFQLYRIN